MNKTKTNTTAAADKEFGDCHFDVSANSKRLVRATLKTYDHITKLIYSWKFSKKQLKTLKLNVYNDFP